jgi:XTP/dITP diphosphohydrolase
MPITRLVVATSNLGKLGEFRALLPSSVTVEGLDAHKNVVLPEETGKTYEENAILKAEAATRATGLPSLGDDSGLEVAALGGAPGLYSARYAEHRAEGQTQDAANREKLLKSLQESGVPQGEWSARFVCALALAVPGERTQVFVADAPGRVVSVARGTNGFGYDPLLELRDLGKTFAELEESEKNRLSHRGQAVRLMVGAGLLNGQG